MNDGWVYFIWSNDQNAIKIGYADNVEARIKKLQTGNPHELNLLEAIRGTKELERALQKKFAQHRISREWFRDDEAFFIFFENLETLREHVVAGMSMLGKWRDADAILDAMENMVFDDRDVLGLSLANECAPA